MKRFFQDLYAILVKGGRWAFQFYPETPEQVESLTHAAMKNGFTGGLIVDYPNSKKAKKYFLFLMAGYSQDIVDDAKKLIYMPKALGEDGKSDDDEEEKQISVYKDQKKNHNKKRTKWDRKGITYTQWVKNKKERQRRQGRSVKPDSKYTARKRKDRF